MMTGNITLIANTLGYANLDLKTTGDIDFSPRTASLAINVNGSSGLVLGNTQLSLIDTTTLPSLVIFGNPNNGSGLVTVTGTYDVHTYNFPLEIVGGYITTGGITTGGHNLTLDALSGDITVNTGSTFAKSTGGSEVMTLEASGNILLEGSSGNNVTLSSTTNAMNVILDSNDTSSGAGAISLAYTNITTNGGNITMGGGSNIASGSAIGDSSYTSGIVLQASTLSAASGNITLTGTGYSSTSGSDYGVYLYGGSSITTTGSGIIAITGTGGAGGGGNSSNDYGIYDYGTGGATSISSASGNITLIGNGGGNGTGEQITGFISSLPALRLPVSRVQHLGISRLPAMVEAVVVALTSGFMIQTEVSAAAEQ